MARVVLDTASMTNNREDVERKKLVDLAAGVENLRRMFRRTMAAQAARTGEPLEAAKARIERDPATAKIAVLLSTTVPALLEGFGEEQRFLVDAGYDHAVETARIDAIVEKVASARIGLDDAGIRDAVERAPKREAPIAAPCFGAPRDPAETETARRLIAERAQRPPSERGPRVTASFTSRWR